MNDAILQEISDFCRQSGLAESTFGRRAVNDGKLASRLRNGGRITTETLDRIRGFMASHQGKPALSRPLVIERQPALRAPLPSEGPVPINHAATPDDPQRNFRFFDNRQKYLLFVNTCSEKWVVASRVALELHNIHPRPPAVRVFDAGVGDGSVLSRVMRSMHDRFPNMPFYVVGKEISLEDIRLTMQKMADRLLEHPQSVIVLTNLAYADAPWLAVKSLSAASSMVWHEVPLTGNTAHSFETQIMDLEPFLAENWKAGVSPKTGNPVYERPVVLVLYRDDHKFLLDPIIPKPGGTVANYDLVIASQPYRARASTEFKAKRVIAPLARALGPGGRLLGIHSYGHDPGMEIIQRVWPNDNPFTTDRHQLLKAVKNELGPAGRELNFNAYADNRSLFRYEMHTLPSEVSESIGTSTAFAAWNAAIYVAQIEDDRLGTVVSDGRYLEATREVLRKHGGLWFFDESYVISRQTGTEVMGASHHACSSLGGRRRIRNRRGHRGVHARRLARSDAAERGRCRGAEGRRGAGHAGLSQRGADAAAGGSRRAGEGRARRRARAGAASRGAQLRLGRCAEALPRPARRRSGRAQAAGDRGRPRRAGRTLSRRAGSDQLRPDHAQRHHRHRHLGLSGRASAHRGP